jgi:hypothetical protein
MMQRMQLLTEACNKMKHLQLHMRARRKWIALDVRHQCGITAGSLYPPSIAAEADSISVCWCCTPARCTQVKDDFFLVPCVHWMNQMMMVAASTRQCSRLRRLYGRSEILPMVHIGNDR